MQIFNLAPENIMNCKNDAWKNGIFSLWNATLRRMCFNLSPLDHKFLLSSSHTCSNFFHMLRGRWVNCINLVAVRRRQLGSKPRANYFVTSNYVHWCMCVFAGLRGAHWQHGPLARSGLARGATGSYRRGQKAAAVLRRLGPKGAQR